MRRCVFIMVGLVAFSAVCWVFPPFYIISLKQAQAAKTLRAFNPAEFAARFWSERLTPAWGKAADAQVVLAALSSDPQKAATNFGRTIGLSDAVYLFMQGTGTMVSVEGKSIGVSLRGATAKADLQIKTGMLFGNAVRDATGLLTASEFPNSQNFNDISTELNRIVESQIIPNLKTNAAVGRPVRFAVCAELAEDELGERPVKVIPVRVEFR